MTGSKELPGLTPRSINELFRLIEEKKTMTVKVSTYFMELYNDNLVDLFYVLDNKHDKNLLQNAPKLEIKMDKKNMIFITNAVIKEVEGICH